MSGIYIHIPFCKQACHYCNFHFSTSLKYKDDMVNTIIKEIEMTEDYLEKRQLDSIYFGGGTPSLLSPYELDSIVQKLSKYYHWSKQVEFTLEANPDDLDRNKIEEFTEVGVNRWSLGIQSFVEKDLRYMNRAHNSKEALTALGNLQEWGSENITVDLIYGTPTLSDSDWISNIKKAIDMGIKHLSCYALTIEEGTALAHFIKKGKSPPTDPEKARRHFNILMSIAENAGFIHYEISNFAYSGHLAIHNSNYWKGVPYLGIGPAAHSFNGVSRRWNIANNVKYMKSINSGELPFQIEILSPEDKYHEYVMTGLRTIWGVDVRRLEEPYKDYFMHGMRKFQEQGFVSYNESSHTYILTREGKHLADFIAMELFST